MTSSSIETKLESPQVEVQFHRYAGPGELNRALFGERFTLLQPELGPDGKFYALFDSREDPQETRDLLVAPRISAENRRIFEELTRRADEQLPFLGQAESTFRAIDAEQERRLRSLGYLN